MRPLVKVTGIGALAALLIWAVSPASANPTGEATLNGDTVYGKAEELKRRLGYPPQRRASPPPRPTPPNSAGSNRLPADTKQEVAGTRTFEYGSTLDVCQREVLLAAISASCIPQGPRSPAASPVPAPRVVPAISPQQAAQRAVARLTLTAPKPGIGPPPEINRWKMAAVGYPMWLWVEGNTNPAPVSDSVGGLFVSLDARIQQISFDMGDGHTVRCGSAGTKWTRAVEPAQKSPTCGYTYQKPSLPKGEYTITATTTWAVDWNINGTTGTIPLTQSASTTLPVGELQALVR